MQRSAYNTYLTTSGRGVLGDHRSQRPPRPDIVYHTVHEDAEDKLQKAKKRAERKEHMRKLRRMIEDDVEHDVAVEPPEDRRRWSLEEQKRVDAVLDRHLEKQWGIDDRVGHDAFLQALDEEHEAMLRMRQKFLNAWAAFEDTHYGRILTANPDMADKLKSMLLKCFENSGGRKRGQRRQ
jgi:hypothetical protein